MTQNLDLEITTTIHTNHDKCNDKLKILTGSGDTNKGTKQADLTLGCTTLAGTVRLTMPYAPGTL